MQKIRIGSRASFLALAQTKSISKQLEAIFPEILWEIIPVKTEGDISSQVPLAEIGGEGVFVKQLEHLLLKGEIDMAVHSMKDLPSSLPEGLEIAAVPQRVNPCDVLVSCQGVHLDDLPFQAVIGTGSLRRKAQILYHRKDFEIKGIRGNIDTRIKKLKPGEIDAIVLAYAGLYRLGMKDKISYILPHEICLPAVGQGALCLQARAGDSKLIQKLQTLHHQESSWSINAERSFLKRLGGGCHVPIAALAEIKNQQLHLRGLVAHREGEKIIRSYVLGDPQQAEDMGKQLADQLLLSGAEQLLKE